MYSFIELAKQKKTKKIVVAMAEDTHALKAIKLMIDHGLGEAILIGCGK